MTPNPYTLVMGAAVAVLGSAQAVYAYRRRGGWAHRLRETPINTTRDAEPGVVRLEGTARAAGPPVTSTLWKKECLAFVVTLEERQSSGKNVVWVEKWRDQAMAPFFLEDATGRARVEVDVLAKLELRKEPVVVQDGLDEMPPHILEIVHKAEVDLMGVVLASRFRINEWRLDAGEPCTVIGEVLRREADTAGAAAGYRDAPVIPIVGAGSSELWVADLAGAALDEVFRKKRNQQVLVSIGSGAVAAVMSLFV